MPLPGDGPGRAMGSLEVLDRFFDRPRSGVCLVAQLVCLVHGVSRRMGARLELDDVDLLAHLIPSTRNSPGAAGSPDALTTPRKIEVKYTRNYPDAKTGKLV